MIFVRLAFQHIIGLAAYSMSDKGFYHLVIHIKETQKNVSKVSAFDIIHSKQINNEKQLKLKAIHRFNDSKNVDSWVMSTF